MSLDMCGKNCRCFSPLIEEFKVESKSREEFSTPHFHRVYPKRIKNKDKRKAERQNRRGGRG